MTCREFTKKVDGLSLAELSRAADVELMEHEQGCADCAGWFRQRHELAGAMQTLRSSTASMRAPVDVEHAVLRAFRQSPAAAPVPASEKMPQPIAFHLSRWFGWGAYAAVAAALAISVGLGIWFLQHSGKTPAQAAQPSAVKTEQPVQAKITKSDQVAQSAEVQAPEVKKSVEPTVTSGAAIAQSKTAASGVSLAQTAQAQGYTPLMLCDPLSCSGDEQVVRLELPATAADGSVGTQMADVVVGDDGLVRAIRIVQQ